MNVSTGPLARAAVLFLALFTGAAALAQESEDDFFVFDPEEDATPSPSIADPLERFNRAMFTLNDKLYRGVLKPVAVAYRKVPRPVRASVANVLDNLGTPVSALNALLQLDFRNAGTEMGRFAINTTFGILGLFDPATEAGLVADNEDLGQTLGRWGLGHGVYLVIPGRGPSSLRDAAGSAGNFYMDPFMSGLRNGERVGVILIDATTSVSLDQDTYEALYDRALDPYIFFRSAYVQNRDGQVAR